MQPFETGDAYPVFLSATLPASGNRQKIHLILRDAAGTHGAGVLDLATYSGQPLPGQHLNWAEFLEDYRACQTGTAAQQVFGDALLQAILQADASLGQAWAAIQSKAGGQPLKLLVSFGPSTEAFAELPLELLHHAGQFLFARPQGALIRCFEHNSAAAFDCAADARILFAWAKPAGAGSDFDPTPHEARLRNIFGTRLDVLPNAQRDSLQTTLHAAKAQQRPYQFLHLLAHGGHDGLSGCITLNGPDGGPDWVGADLLGQAVRDSGVQLAFLCACQSAVAGDNSFSGVAQQLLSPASGNLSVVIATQANLPVARSAELAASFYRQLGPGTPPGHALASARVRAYQGTPLRDAWSIPICLARPNVLPQEAAERARDHASLNNLPARRDSFQPRPDIMRGIGVALAQHRLVSLVGLPGIGKTELGKESARAYQDEHPDVRLIYQPITRGLTPDLLRGLIATALGQAAPPEDDAGLARLLAAKPTLLVLDNAEDMMLDAPAQAAFAQQLDAWLDAAPQLKALLTTRWKVDETRQTEHAESIPPMTRAETEALLLAELALNKVQTTAIRMAWSADPAWQRLLDFLDGHPRSVWLVSRHFDGPRASLARVVERLEKAHAKAVVDSSLIGRKDHDAVLSNADQQRMRSLVASIDFSFEVVQTRHPEAAAAFLQLAVFPGGVPEPVAIATLGADIDANNGERDALAADSLDSLYRYHLLEWQGNRIYYPMPLQWYAEHKGQGGLQLSPAAREAALAAYADYVETLDAGLRHDQSPAWVADWLKEERTLLNLASPPAPVEAQAHGPSSLARLAAAARNLMSMANRHSVWQQLTEAGLSDARARRDTLGEANTLRALGDLLRRTDQLDPARKAYEHALDLYQQIDHRLGEANTLQGLGLLALGDQDAAGAFRRFASLLDVFRAIDDRLGQQAALGYAARAAAALAETDRALLLAGASLALGWEVDDRFGQSINLGLLLGLFQQADDGLGCVACLALYRAVLGQLGDEQRQGEMDELWRQLEAQAPAEMLAAVVADPRAAILHALADARQRFGDGAPLVRE